MQTVIIFLGIYMLMLGTSQAISCYTCIDYMLNNTHLSKPPLLLKLTSMLKLLRSNSNSSEYMSCRTSNSTLRPNITADCASGFCGRTIAMFCESGNKTLIDVRGCGTNITDTSLSTGIKDVNNYYRIYETNRNDTDSNTYTEIDDDNEDLEYETNLIVNSTNINQTCNVGVYETNDTDITLNHVCTCKNGTNSTLNNYTEIVEPPKPMFRAWTLTCDTELCNGDFEATSEVLTSKCPAVPPPERDVYMLLDELAHFLANVLQLGIMMVMTWYTWRRVLEGR